MAMATPTTGRKGTLAQLEHVMRQAFHNFEQAEQRGQEDVLDMMEAAYFAALNRFELFMRNQPALM